MHMYWKMPKTQPLDQKLSEGSDNVDTDIPLIPDSDLELSDKVQKWLKKHKCVSVLTNLIATELIHLCT